MDFLFFASQDVIIVWNSMQLINAKHLLDDAITRILYIEYKRQILSMASVVYMWRLIQILNYVSQSSFQSNLIEIQLHWKCLHWNKLALHFGTFCCISVFVCHSIWLQFYSFDKRSCRKSNRVNLINV